MTELTVRLIEPHEYDTWDEFVETSPQGTLFHTSVWKSVIDASYVPSRLLLISCFDKHNLAGGCVALERERLGTLTAVTPLVTPYAGFILEPPAGEKISDQVSRETEVITALIGWMSGHFHYLNLVNPPHLDDMRPLIQAGCKLVPRFTYYLNLRLHADEIWQRFDGSVRRQIKKAELEHFDITDNFDPMLAYDIFAGTFRRHGGECPVSREMFLQITTSEHLRDMRDIICAHIDNKLASYIVLLKFQQTLYYALASTDGEYLHTGVNSLLIWEIVKMYAGREWNVLDFVGANVPSISRFKEGFNPRLQMHFQTEHYSGTFLKIGKTIRDFLVK
ncbi:MAG: GNAT family N-acetyltransferase [bacterium]|nr:GNAT family N-acetyltransferase [Candidatus Sumerlaeota bacterium]